MAETAVARRQTSKSIYDTLSVYTESVERALPKSASDLNAQRIIQIAATVIMSNKNLASCDAGSVVAAVMQAAILGLNPLPQLAEAYFVPYSGAVTFQTGYRGWINLYHRCRLVREVYAAVVRDGDEFDYEQGLERKLRHKPIADVASVDNGSNITHAYAVVHYTNGGSNFVVLTKKQLDQLKARGAGGPSWKSSYEAMAMAKALKQLRRVMPSDGSIDGAYAADERVFRAEALTTDGNGVNLAALEAVEVAPLAEVKAPNFIGNGSTAEDTANAITASEEIERLGIMLHGDAWPEASAKLFSEITKGAATVIEDLSPIELSQAVEELRKGVAAQTENGQSKKGGK